MICKKKYPELEEKIREIRERISFYMNRNKVLPIVTELCEDMMYLLEVIEDEMK